MEVIIQPTPDAASATATRLVARLLYDKPNAVLGLPTGNTARVLYRQLAAMQLDWSQVTTFNLDEYVGLSPEHPQSYHYFMWENLFNHVNVAKERVHIPDGQTGNIPTICAQYEESIRNAGGIDLQILGIGSEGHIGFNEPSSSLASRTRIKTLTMRTRADNASSFGGESRVPHHVITMGVGTIMEARQILLLAFGKEKAHAVAQAVEGAVTAMNPASALQMHPTVKVILDEAAAGQLTRIGYYRWVYDNKPDWQKF
jgi:glucosamine-6-phosphate deaminase